MLFAAIAGFLQSLLEFAEGLPPENARDERS
jgi:hypothetical protein